MSKFYWLKLDKNFFKRHDIMIVENMPNGKDYILFYLKLLVESVAHDGELRFSDAIPYNEQMLSVVTNTNVDIVRNAMKIFTDLKMIEVMEDATIFMAEVNKMIGSCQDDQTRESNRIRQQKFRDKHKLCDVTLSNCYVDVIRNGEKEIEKEKELESDKELEKEDSKGKRKRFIPPTLTQIKERCEEMGYQNVDPERFFDFYESKGWMVGRNKMTSWERALAGWNAREKAAKPEQKGKYDAISSWVQNYQEREGYGF